MSVLEFFLCLIEHFFIVNIFLHQFATVRVIVFRGIDVLILLIELAQVLSLIFILSMQLLRISLKPSMEGSIPNTYPGKSMLNNVDKDFM